jgi:hypothetical protein
MGLAGKHLGMGLASDLLAWAGMAGHGRGIGWARHAGPGIGSAEHVLGWSSSALYMCWACTEVGMCHPRHGLV